MLARTINVSSFHKCLHNTDVPRWLSAFPSLRNYLKNIAVYAGHPDLIDDDFESIVRRSKFMVSMPNKYSLASVQFCLHIVVENTILENYVSEKAWQALHLGAVPIYLGAPNVDDILPRGSFVNLLHFATSHGTYDFLSLKAVLNRALNSPEEYARYHAWRLPNRDLKMIKLLAETGNSQTFVMNRKTRGDRKRLTCDICSYLFSMQRQQRLAHSQAASLKNLTYGSTIPT